MHVPLTRDALTRDTAAFDVRHERGGLHLLYISNHHFPSNPSKVHPLINPFTFLIPTSTPHPSFSTKYLPHSAPTPTMQVEPNAPKPETSSRQEFTQYYLDKPLPPNAADKYKHIWETLNKLLKLLIEHPAMAQNKDQTYMTPAASKNKVYFM